MIPENFVIVGAIIGALGSLHYLIDTIKGRVKPNRVTFFLWALAPLIAFSAEISKGVGIQSLMTFSVGFFPLVIFLASFLNKKSVWKLHTLDFAFGGFSLLGLLLWYITKEGNIAILFSVLADGLAAVPTIVKSFNHPETESAWPYSTAFVNAGLTLLTIKVWDFAHYAFPVYILAVTLILTVLIQFKLGKRVRGYQA
jgi:hypothetical protein